MVHVEQKGIKELGEALEFGLSFAKVGFQQLQNGPDLGDLFALLPVLKLAPEAVKGANEIPAELADLSDEEVEFLVKRTKELLNGISDEKAQAIALKATQFGLVAIQLFDAVTSPAA